MRPNLKYQIKRRQVRALDRLIEKRKDPLATRELREVEEGHEWTPKHKQRPIAVEEAIARIDAEIANLKAKGITK